MTNKDIEFSPWPLERQQYYRRQGYWIDRPLTAILTTQCSRKPDAPAVICGERCFSYSDLDRLSSNLASHLAAHGLGRGDTALVQLPNIAEFYIVFFALLKAGIAPLNALYSHRQHELGAFAAQIRPRLLIASRAHEVFRDDTFISQLRETPSVADITLMLDEQLSDWMDTPNASSGQYAPSAADSVAFFQLSGGSTGTPKLIPRTHNDYDYSVRASARVCDLTADTRLLCALPAAHNFMLSSPGALGVFEAGGCVVMAASPEPVSCFALVQQHGVTMAALVPSAVALWLQAARTHSNQLQTLKLVQVGGACFAESLARQVPTVLGCQLQQVFGMAEGLVNYTRLDDPDEQIFTSQGRPVSPADEVRVVDDQGQPVPDGTPGRLATRGPYTFCGYYRSNAHNAEAFDAEGYYYSGDLVERTPEGNLRVVGRVKDQINRGGEKIASEEIESLIIHHPDVTQAALVAYPDAQLGEKSCAFIVSQNPDLKPIAIRRHLLQLGLAEYKLPDRIQHVRVLPLTPIGKTDKKTLRDTLTPPHSEHTATTA